MRERQFKRLMTRGSMMKSDELKGSASDLSFRIGLRSRQAQVKKYYT